MKLLNDGAADVCVHMARDAALLQRAEGDPGFEATLRVFRFDPAGITLGRSQNPNVELDVERCIRDGVDWAVRPTGGRAIFHEHEWTFALVCRIADPLWGGPRSVAYGRCTTLIARSLERLGIAVEAGRGVRVHHGGGPRGQRIAPPCFASTARHEISRAGRKLVGSAQRRTRNALVQQGSVLLGPGHLRIADYLAVADEDRESARARLEACSTSIGEQVSSLGLEDWAAALRQVANETENVRIRPAASDRVVMT